VDKHEGDVAARSRALFEQLRAMRSKSPPEPDDATATAPSEAASTDADPGDGGVPAVGEAGPIAYPTPEEVGPPADGPDVPEPGPPHVAEAPHVAVDPTGRAGEGPPAGERAGGEDATEGDGLAGAGPGPVTGDGSEPRHPAADLPLPRVIAIANQKGGVGKTTTAVNLGAALAELGYRTLIIDLDPQGNATTGLGVNARNLEHAIYDVLMHDLPLDESIEPTSVRNLFVAPATIDLAGAEIELVPAFSRELRLRRAVADIGDDYDFTIIDCPPSLGLLTVNGLAAATEVVVPIQCEYYALEGLSQLLRNVSLVQANLNPTLVVSAIILTMYDARTKLADQVAAEVRQHFGAKVCRNVVPRTVRLSEAPSFGQPIIVFDPASRGALAYRELAKEVSGGAPQRVG
jgi:chromosome partitioning protein